MLTALYIISKYICIFNSSCPASLLSNGTEITQKNRLMLVRNTAAIKGAPNFFRNVVMDKSSSCCLKLKQVKCTLVQALRLCTVRTAHRGSRGIALLLGKCKVHPCTGTEAL